VARAGNITSNEHAGVEFVIYLCCILSSEEHLLIVFPDLSMLSRLKQFVEHLVGMVVKISSSAHRTAAAVNGKVGAALGADDACDEVDEGADAALAGTRVLSSWV